MTEGEKKISLIEGIIAGKKIAKSAKANRYFIVGYAPETDDCPAIVCTYCELKDLEGKEREDYVNAIVNAMLDNGIIQEMNKIRKKEEGAAN